MPPAGAFIAVLAQRRPRVRWAFVAITLFFTVWPFISVLQSRPEPAALALLLLAWAIFGIVLLQLFRFSPFGRVEDRAVLLPAVAALTAIGFVTTTVFGVGAAPALFYYAGVSSARLIPQSWSVRAITAISVVAAASVSIHAGDPSAGVPVGITVGTISLTLASLSALARTNRELQAARMELAEVAVAEERMRIARDLHDTLGHSLSVIALKSELARRLLPGDPARAADEIGDVERTARDAMAAVRETVSGFRQPTLAMELAGAREALRVAGISGTVEPAPERLPRDVDVLLGWAVREGVTNVLRHSDARSATIRVIADGARHGVEIVDDGRGPGPDPLQADGGHGLTGLRERAGRLGGGVDSGTVDGGGFRLAVTVPAERGTAS
jgi:two-component system, NarL family, sensor histidine kinase DesK